jgi:hypothetical protein
MLDHATKVNDASVTTAIVESVMLIGGITAPISFYYRANGQGCW